MSDIEETRQVLRDYFYAWANGDSEGIVEIMADDCEIISTAAGFRISGRTWPRDCVVELIAEAYGAGFGFHMVDATHGTVTLRIIEHMEVRGGLVSKITQACDRETYDAFCRGSH